MGASHRCLKTRFQAKYRIDAETGCWLWTAFKNAGGYGVISVRRRPQMAHRVSYELHTGLIPDGLFVLHSCDVPACVNPAHLRVGTALDNMRDAVERERLAVGLRNGKRRLWPEAILHIRKREMKGYEYAALYGVSPATITAVLRKYVWRQTGGEANCVSQAEIDDHKAAKRWKYGREYRARKHQIETPLSQA